MLNIGLRFKNRKTCVYTNKSLKRLLLRGVCQLRKIYNNSCRQSTGLEYILRIVVCEHIVKPQIIEKSNGRKCSK